MSDSNSYSISYIGRRDSNQDACLVIHQGQLTFLAVADGMGGTIGGGIASETVIDACRTRIEKLADKPPSPKELKNSIVSIFEDSRNQLKLIIDKHPELINMGTTLSCLLLLDNYYAWGSIGDSRVYHYKNESLHQLTVDHTLVEEYRREYGDKIPEYIRQRSNVITRCLGGEDDQPDVFPADKDYETIEPGEGFLICSDGLLPEKVDTDTSWLVDYLLGSKTLELAAKNMVSNAYHLGSTDNISLVLYEHFGIKRQKKKIRHYHFPPNEQPDNNDSGVQKRIFRSLLVFMIVVFMGLSGYYVVDKIKGSEIDIVSDISAEQAENYVPDQPASASLHDDWDPANKLREGLPIRISREKVNWDQYPDSHLVDRYELRFIPKEGKNESVIVTKESNTQIDLKEHGLLPGEYTLIISAVLNDSIKKQGKEVHISLTK